MRKKIKSLIQDLKQDKKARINKFNSRKKNFNEDYQKKFPIPQMEKSTDELLKDEKNRPNSESLHTTKKFLKFRLI